MPTLLKTHFLLPILFWFLAPVTAGTAPHITGPVSAKVVKVYDGDTFTVEAYPWPGLEAKASVRVNGVDTPEIRGQCETEKQKAIEAREFVKGLVLGEVVFLQNVKYGKYAGRVVADVKLEGGDWPLNLVGLEKSGPFVDHAAEIAERLKRGSALTLDNDYISLKNIFKPTLEGMINTQSHILSQNSNNLIPRA